MKQTELGNLFKISLRSIAVFRLCWKTNCCKFPVSRFLWSWMVWHLWVYLPSCFEGIKKIWIKICYYYLYTRHNNTKFLCISSVCYKFKISSGYKSLHVLYINLCISTMQSKESKHNIFLPEGKICFLEYLVSYKTELWMSQCQSHVMGSSPFWCPDPPGVHDQILFFVLNADYCPVSWVPSQMRVQVCLLPKYVNFPIYLYTFFFVFPYIRFFLIVWTMFSWSISAIHY
jgi:hypothetical protein